jgi:hypothetical protein
MYVIYPNSSSQLQGVSQAPIVVPFHILPQPTLQKSRNKYCIWYFTCTHLSEISIGIYILINLNQQALLQSERRHI